MYSISAVKLMNIMAAIQKINVKVELAYEYSRGKKLN